MYVGTVTALCMHSGAVKTVTITLPAELDGRAAAKAARRRGISKSELIRRGLEAVLPAGQDHEGADPWRSLAGFGSPGLSVEPGEIDDAVYGA